MTPMRLSTVLSVLSLLSLNSCFAYTDRNVTVDDNDASVVLSPFPAWATSDQAHDEHGGTFVFSNAENATVVFTFTQNATAVFWQGFKRAGPALYSVCLDCTDPSQAQFVDGHDPDPESINSVTTLFSTDVPSNDRHNHTLIIKNLFDPRFRSSSQITVDSFILTLSTSSWSTPPLYPAVAASPVPSMTSMMSDGASPTTAGYWSKSNHKSTLSTGAIIGIAFAAAIAVLGAVATWWFLRRRMRSSTMYRNVFGSDNQKQWPSSEDPESPMFSTLRIPPRDAEQASMFVTTATAYSDSNERVKPYLDRPQLPSPSPISHATRPPSIRSAFSSTLSREPSTRSESARSEWGTITVVMNNPFASPHDADAESDRDFDTPLPSSELGSTFTTRDRRQLEEDARTQATVMREVTVQSAGHPVISMPPMWRRSEGDSDGERTPTMTRGWRRVES